MRCLQSGDKTQSQTKLSHLLLGMHCTQMLLKGSPVDNAAQGSCVSLNIELQLPLTPLMAAVRMQHSSLLTLSGAHMCTSSTHCLTVCCLPIAAVLQ